MAGQAGLNWRAINARLWIYYLVCFGALWTPAVKFAGMDLRVVACAILGPLFGPVIRSVGNNIRDYEPTSVVDAKRVNEQIKSTAGMLNTFATASVSIFALSEVRNGVERANLIVIMLALGFALYVHSGARNLLGLLKDEAVTVKPVDISSSVPLGSGPFHHS